MIWNSVIEEYKVYKKVKDPVTGKYMIDHETGKPIKIDTGRTKIRTQKSTKMAETDDAFTLVSEANTPQEILYAEYANQTKSLANRARKEMVTTGKIKYDASAKAAYQPEVDSLLAQLNVALKNAPRERKAQAIANTKVAAKKQANPDMTPAEIKKAGQQALTIARVSVGAKRDPIKIKDREWDAIQAGAITETVLTKIINNVDIDDLRQRATPRATTSLSPAKINKIAAMKASGYSTREIAKDLGVSTALVTQHMNGKR